MLRLRDRASAQIDLAERKIPTAGGRIDRDEADTVGTDFDVAGPALVVIEREREVRQAHQAAAGCDLVIARAGFMEIPYNMSWKSLRWAEVHELVAVKTGQTFTGAKPQKPAAIPDDLVDGIAGQALRGGERLHGEPFAPQGGAKDDGSKPNAHRHILVRLGLQTYLNMWRHGSELAVNSPESKEGLAVVDLGIGRDIPRTL